MSAFFGSAFPWVPLASTAFTPGVVVVSTVAVYFGVPLGERNDIEDAADAFWDGIASPEPSRLLPLVVLLLGLLIVSRSSGLIDTIRARDEAAKEANRLLGEMFGRLVHVRRDLFGWRDKFERLRWKLVSDWVSAVSASRYRWGVDGGIERDDTRTGFAPLHDDWPTNDVLERMCDELAGIAEQINARGLHYVARALTRRRFATFRALRLLMIEPSTSAIQRALPTPAAARRDLERMPSLLGQYPAAGSPREDFKRFEQYLEDEAFDRARVADHLLAQLLMSEKQVDRAFWYLRSRTLGNVWTRAMSAIQK